MVHRRGEGDGCEGVGATKADGGEARLLADIGGEAPAAFALGSGGRFSLRVKGALLDTTLGHRGVHDLDLRGAEEFRKDAGIALEDGIGLFRDGVQPAKNHPGLCGFIADGLRGACLFQNLENLVAEREEMIPVVFKLLKIPWHDVSHVRKEGEMDAGFAAFDRGEQSPYLVRSEAEDRSDQPGKSFGDAPERGLRAAAARMIRRKGIEPVLEHVEVERGEIGVHELVQRMVGAMKFEVVVGLADLGVQLREPGENVLIERLKLVEGDGLGGGIEVVEVAK